MRQLTWFNKLPPIGEEAILAVEASFGVKFPEDYRHFLRTDHGGAPEETDFILDDERKSVAAVGTFLSMVPESSADYIVTTRKLLGDRLPDSIIPIAVGPGGDYLCLDYRYTDHPGVVYWHHERIGDADEFTPVSRTFSEFLDILCMPDTELESKLD